MTAPADLDQKHGQHTAATPTVLPKPLGNVDGRLRQSMASITGSPEYWSFVAARNGYSHCYFRYPAMMIAEMQRDLISLILGLQPDVRTLADPFAGSGTILLEAMFRGLDVCSHDVNPLAILLCKSKLVLTDSSSLRLAAEGALDYALIDDRTKVEADFYGLNKWFSEIAIQQLSKLRRAIRRVSSLQVRRFLWVALAETVRQTSNSRTSTYKLHIRPSEDLGRLPTPFDKFAEVIEENIQSQETTRAELRRSGLLTRNKYARKAHVAIHDVRRPFARKFDLVVTSPPYGDNQTTVPYGQSSFLPLQWIDLVDIDSRIASSCLQTAYEIDNRSLGGRAPRGVRRRSAAELCAAAPSLARMIRCVPKKPPDRRRRILTFVQDIDRSLSSIAKAMNPNAYLVFTIGNRRVANREVPLDAIIAELFREYGVIAVLSVTRRIPTKRMASRNNVASTIRREQIAIFRKNES